MKTDKLLNNYSNDRLTVVVCGVYAAYAGCGSGAEYLYACWAGAYPCVVQLAPRYGVPAIPPAGLVMAGL